MTASVSDQWRNQGNAVYVSAKTDLPPTVRESRLQNAVNLFHRALDAATTNNEIASAAKNIGVSSWKLASVGCIMGHSWYTIKYHFGTSLKSLCRSYEVGTKCGKPMSWCDNILASIRSCFEEIRQVEARDLNELQLSVALREFIEYIPAPDIKADCFIEIAQFHFSKGIVCLGIGNYKKCISELKECHFPLNEAVRYGKDVQSVQTECGVIEADIVMQMSIAEAMKSRETGDQLLEDILLDEETLNIDMVWEIIDWYKDSILKGRDLDIKQEAMSLSRIGKVYDKVLKIKFKAREYLKKALELAQSITPFDVSNEDWYKDCTDILSRYQRETVQHEQEEHDKKRQAVKEELKDVFAELEKHKDDDYKTFLRFIYEKFPPVNPKHKLDLPNKEKKTKKQKEDENNNGKDEKEGKEGKDGKQKDGDAKKDDNEDDNKDKNDADESDSGKSDKDKNEKDDDFDLDNYDFLFDDIDFHYDEYESDDVDDYDDEVNDDDDEDEWEDCDDDDDESGDSVEDDSFENYNEEDDDSTDQDDDDDDQNSDDNEDGNDDDEDSDDDVEDFSVKYKALQKAVIHFHPDRVNEDEHGLKAKVLNEEITKYLTNRYEKMKSMK